MRFLETNTAIVLGRHRIVAEGTLQTAATIAAVATRLQAVATAHIVTMVDIAVAPRSRVTITMANHGIMVVIGPLFAVEPARLSKNLIHLLEAVMTISMALRIRAAIRTSHIQRTGILLVAGLGEPRPEAMITIRLGAIGDFSS